MVRCGAGAGLNIEGCGAVRAPALNDCAVRCGLLHCGVMRSRAKLLGPRRALVASHDTFTNKNVSGITARRRLHVA